MTEKNSIEEKVTELENQLGRVNEVLERINEQMYEIRCAVVASSDHDELYDNACDLAKERGEISPAMIQRYLRVGYARACRLMDILYANGVIADWDGAKPRKYIKPNN